MRSITLAAVMLGFLASTTFAEEQQQRHIQVTFVLDTTGSMSGLIEGAKEKIWSIANTIVSENKGAKLQLGLIGYRDRGDEYITRVYDLTDDIDLIYEKLRAFEANGGGDGPESVNQALHEAVTKISWNDSDDVLKIIFLVGDAPPHMDYDNDVRYPEVCKLAVEKNLIINTIQCGNQSDTTAVWQEIARSAEGEFVQLEQSGGMVAIATPVDAELAELNAELGRTIVPFGDRTERERALAKQSAAESAPASAAADRLAYNLASRKVVQGNDELIDAIDEGRVKLEDVKDEQLPEEMRAMTETQRQEHVEKLRAQRAELQAKVSDLLQQRQAHIDAERRRLADSGQGDAFDQKITEIVRTQVRKEE